MWLSVHPEKGRTPRGGVPAGKAPKKRGKYATERAYRQRGLKLLDRISIDGYFLFDIQFAKHDFLFSVGSAPLMFYRTSVEATSLRRSVCRP